MELVLDDIKVVYRRAGVETNAVRGVSLRVQRGQTVAVVGESGSGKTTVAKVAAGLQKATSGSLSWRSSDGATGSRRVQMVFQHSVQSLDPTWKIRRAVREPLVRRGVACGEADTRVADMVTRVGLDTSVLDRYPRQVSGGQAQRVAIARALVADPEIVILDEPTSSLDQTIRGRILALLADLQQQTGVGYLLVSHDISSVRRLATRIAVMRRGVVVEWGPAPVVLDDASHPYTKSLIAAVPIADPRVRWERTASTSGGDCPVTGSVCADHGAGLHPVGPDHLVACTAGPS